MPLTCPYLARVAFMDKSFFHFEGRKIYFEQGMSIAAALLCNGIKDFRQTQVLRKSRGPFCMMGSCFDCLLIIRSNSECGMKSKLARSLTFSIVLPKKELFINLYKSSPKADFATVRF